MKRIICDLTNGKSKTISDLVRENLSVELWVPQLPSLHWEPELRRRLEFLLISQANR